MGKPSLEDQRALAKKMFPHQWAATLKSQDGEQRRRRQSSLRKRALYQQALQPLRNTGASCATCKHFLRNHFPAGNKDCCAVMSDHEGYAIMRPDQLCIDWKSHP